MPLKTHTQKCNWTLKHAIILESIYCTYFMLLVCIQNLCIMCTVYKLKSSEWLFQMWVTEHWSIKSMLVCYSDQSPHVSLSQTQLCLHPSSNSLTRSGQSNAVLPNSPKALFTVLCPCPTLCPHPRLSNTSSSLIISELGGEILAEDGCNSKGFGPTQGKRKEGMFSEN